MLNTDVSPTKLAYLRAARRHLTADEQCIDCGERAYLDTDCCPEHHNAKARKLLDEIAIGLDDLRELIDQAGDILDADLLRQAEAVATGKAVLV